MSPTRAEQAEQTRQAVLVTAQRLFAEHGFDATSLQLIADTMGVTKANVYYYFHTKIEILEALLDRSSTAFDADIAVRAAALFDRSPREIMPALGRDGVELVYRELSAKSDQPAGRGSDRRRRETLSRALSPQQALPAETTF
jgi:AcrR family transcriptional regulator